MKAYVIKDTQTNQYAINKRAWDYGPLNDACMFADKKQAEGLCDPDGDERVVEVAVTEC